MKQIPITASTGSQSFRITLNNISYSMTIKWNGRAEFFTIDIADENKTALISGVALKSGVDLLGPFNLGIGGLYVISESGEFVEATYDGIGIDTFLIYLTPEENNV